MGCRHIGAPIETDLKGGVDYDGDAETTLTPKHRPTTILQHTFTSEAEVHKMKRTFYWTLIVLCGTTLAMTALLGPGRLWGQSIDTQAVLAADTTSFEFALELDGDIVGFFHKCAGLASSSDVYEETMVTTGGLQMTQRRPGSRLLWDDITLTRSVGASDAALWQWREQIESDNQGEGLRDGTIILYGPGGETARWRFTNGWPVRLSADESVEKLTIAHDGLQRVSEGGTTRTR